VSTRLETEYTRRILEHYITLALSNAGIRVDADTYSELGGALEELTRLESRIQQLESRLADMEGKGGNCDN
jgi:hypothetical protein